MNQLSGGSLAETSGDFELRSIFSDSEKASRQRSLLQLYHANSKDAIVLLKDRSQLIKHFEREVGQRTKSDYQHC